MASAVPKTLFGRHAKIIATLGPCTDDEATLTALIERGINAVRVNLSFDSVEENIARIRSVRTIAERLGKYVAIIADIPGPKVRVGPLAGGRCSLELADVVRFVRAPTGKDGKELTVGDGFFHDDMITGDRILLADGIIELLIDEIKPDCVLAEVIAEGDVSENSAVHLPAVFLREGPITKSDEPLIEMCVAENVDFIALTYVRGADDLLSARERLESLGKSIPLIAKIDRPEAFTRLDGILERADAVMIRRGDLGAAIELTRVPAVQKEICRLANARGVPVIIATQMLGSMVDAPRPTRAEASDVSNAIVDGADGVVLSAETAIGKHPVEALEMMHRIIVETERDQREDEPRVQTGRASFAETTAAIACRAAHQCGAKLIACFTESGRTAGLVAQYRPQVPIVALCHIAETRRRLAIHWGVHTDALDPVHDSERMVHEVANRLVAGKAVKNGDKIVVVFGAPVGEMGHTNSVRLHVVGD